MISMKKKTIDLNIVIFVLIVQIFAVCNSFAGTPEGKPPKYIFLFIGDGMGLAQTSAVEAYLAATNGKIGMGRLTLSSFPSLGMVSTYAQNRLITCSAAAGTALSTGQKTTINTIGMNGLRTDSLKSIAKLAAEKGMKTGLISTVGLNHATPAAFYAHVPDRNMYYEIARQIPKSGINFFGGGGIMESTGKKTDQPDVWADIRKAGYKIIDNRKDLQKLKREYNKVFVVNPNLDDEWAMPFAIDAGEEDFSLAEITGKAIELLENPNGFFIMAEAGKIDWACHANDAAAMIGEVLELDKAVRKALDFYMRYPEETLIIVTADHETGGFALGNANMKYESDLKLLQNQTKSLQALGKETDQFIAKLDTVNGFQKTLTFLDQQLGLGSKVPLIGVDSLHLFQAYQASVLKKMPFPSKEDNYALYGGNQPIAIAAIKVLARKSGIGWTTWSHTAIPVPVRAIGPGKELFDSNIDNTDIPKNLAKLLKGQLN